jgi:hypothetical protein
MMGTTHGSSWKPAPRAARAVRPTRASPPDARSSRTCRVSPGASTGSTPHTPASGSRCGKILARLSDCFPSPSRSGARFTDSGPRFAESRAGHTVSVSRHAERAAPFASRPRDSAELRATKAPRLARRAESLARSAVRLANIALRLARCADCRSRCPERGRSVHRLPPETLRLPLSARAPPPAVCRETPLVTSRDALALTSASLVTPMAAPGSTCAALVPSRDPARCTDGLSRRAFRRNRHTESGNPHTERLAGFNLRRPVRNLRLARHSERLPRHTERLGPRFDRRPLLSSRLRARSRGPAVGPREGSTCTVRRSSYLMMSATTWLQSPTPASVTGWTRK